MKPIFLITVSKLVLLIFVVEQLNPDKNDLFLIETVNILIFFFKNGLL